MLECRTLDDVRHNIDQLDAEIVELLSRRSGYVAQAARFKDSTQAVIVPDRIEAIIAKVRAHAGQHGSDPDLIEAIYRRMIDCFIEFEQAHWVALNR